MPPISIKELKQALDDATVASTLPGKKNALEQIYNRLGYGSEHEFHTSETLTPDVVNECLEKLLALTRKETNKPLYTRETSLQNLRIAAIEKIVKWNRGHTAEYGPVFPNVSRYRVALQVGLRIRRPRAINQGTLGFCGPASLVTADLKRDPVAYVDFVIALMDTGRAQWGTYLIDINWNHLIRLGYDPGKGPEADYVVLSALRSDVEMAISGPASGAMHSFDLSVGDSHATTPAQMVQILTNAGYSNVCDRTMSDYTAPRDGGGLVNARLRLVDCVNVLQVQAGAAVIMLIKGDLATLAKRGATLKAQITVSAIHELHWILVRRITLTGATVEMKLVTWRWSGTYRFTMSDFLPRFFGYVKADPR